MATEENSRVLRVIYFLITVCLISVPSYAQYGGGTGDANEPYLIYTAEQLDSIGLNPSDWNKNFILMKDIDLMDYQGNSFHLIGNNMQAFNGVFDGNGHTIRNFTYVVTGNEEQGDEAVIENIGFFRSVNYPYAVIKDLGFIDPNIYPASTCSKRVGIVGTLAGYLERGLITNCYVERGSVRAEYRIGGLAGASSGVISECYTTCLVQSAEARPVNIPQRSEFIGGIVGWNYGGEITGCRATGDVSGEAYIGGLAGRSYRSSMIEHSWASGNISGVRQVGGLLGNNEGLLAYCYATGEITGQFHVGGLAGSSSGSTNNCYASGNVSASDRYGGGLFGANDSVMSECCATGSVVCGGGGGGLAGFNSGTIQRCYSLGQVSGGYDLGGLVGENRKGVEELYGFPLVYNGIIEDSYAQGSVSGDFVTDGPYGRIGGLIGYIDGGILSRCYASGVVAGPGPAGGLVGLISDSSEFETEYCFWDITASNQQYSDGGTGLYTEQMQDMNIFIAAGWDFTGETTNGVDDIWTMQVDADMYPQLAWDVEPEPFLIFDFDEDPNWTVQGQWQFGQPQGSGGIEHGYPDPNSGYTGNNVYGVNLSGDYSTTETDAYYLTAGPFDCSQYSWVKLQFARRLNTDEAGFIKTIVEVSTNETDWQTIWEYDDLYNTLEENRWKIVEYDIGSTANHQPTIYIRWGYQVLDRDAWPLSGWNIDDVVLLGIR